VVSASGHRIAVWTPVPPQASGIAAHNAEVLLPALADRADVLVVCADEVAGEAARHLSVPVVGYRAYQGSNEAGLRFPIYHMGNHAEFHGWIHDALLENPGMVVLHDPSLFDFYAASSATPERFAEELRHNYGDAFLRWSGQIEDADRLSMRLDRRVAEAARTIIVHSPWAHDELSWRHPTATVACIPLAAGAARPPSQELDLRSRFGWGDEHVVFGVPAAFAWHKRADVALGLFSAFHREHPDSRLLVVGRLDAPAALARFKERLEASGVGDAVVTLCDLTSVEFDAAITACDVVVDLRWPTAGEVPATLLRAFAVGKPAMVSDLPQVRHLDPAFCWRVPSDPLDGARVALETMHAVARDPSMAQRAGALARSYIEADATAGIVAERYLALVDELAARPDPMQAARPAPPPELEWPIGVNVIGDFRATTGLMEAGRRTVSGLIGTGARLEATPFESHAGRSPTRSSPEIERLPLGRSADIDVWLLNLNELCLVSDGELRPDDRPRYTIAPWFWELPSVPEAFAAQAVRLDEIWVASRFVRDAIASVAPPRTSVVVVPCLVDVPPPLRAERSDFGLPEDATIYFFNFDARSSAARKNPWAIVEAFRMAFDKEERRSRARLVMKVHNLDHAPDLRGPLVDAVEGVGGILIDAELSREDMNGLLASVDIYVSLHRSEGFGLGIAEAMFLGKPTIVTAYSGNMDFTHAGNSCLVGYEFRPITEEDHAHFPAARDVYLPGLPWAEPSIVQASAWMRQLFERPDLRRAVGRAGAATIRSRYSRSAVQRALVPRLQAIRDWLDQVGIPSPVP
jgi:glycosyltransferase involved in cell wall biosynthesis